MSKIKLPRAVQEAANRADEILKAQAEEVANATPPVVTETVTEVQASTSTDPSTSVVVIPQEPTPPKQPDKDAGYWEHRAKTIQGMFDAEKTRLHSKLNETQVKASELEDSVRKLTERLSKTTESTVPKEYDLRKYFSEQQLETYDEPMIRTILRSAVGIVEENQKQHLEREIANRVEPIEKKLKDSEQESKARQDREFWECLNRDMPNWKAINDNDPQWIEWLKETVPFTDFSRQQALTDAEGRRDGLRVVAIFKAYLKEKEVAATVLQQKLDRKVIPDSIPTTQAPSTEIQLMSKSFVNQFYKDLALGKKYYGREKEAQAIEAQIQAAYRANKIV